MTAPPTWKIGVTGQVQGVTYRPSVCRLALELDLRGWGMRDVAGRLAVAHPHTRKRRPDMPLFVMLPGRVMTDGLRPARMSGSSPRPNCLPRSRSYVPAMRRKGSDLARSIVPELRAIGAMLPDSPLYQTRCFALSPTDRDPCVWNAVAPRWNWNCPIHCQFPCWRWVTTLKNPIALGWGKRALIPPHFGDLGSRRDLRIFEQTIADFARLNGVDYRAIVLAFVQLIESAARIAAFAAGIDLY